MFDVAATVEFRNVGAKGVYGCVVVFERTRHVFDDLHYIRRVFAFCGGQIVDFHRAFGDSAGFVKAKHVDARKGFNAIEVLRKRFVARKTHYADAKHR